MIRCCVDRVLDPGLLGVAAPLAVAENPLNHPRHLDHMAAVPFLAALATDKKWQPGRVLTIGFRYGSTAMRGAVMEAAAEWSKYANISFKEVAENPVIRCSFDESLGSWSYIGTDILAIPASQATMNIGWGPDLPTCLHELGHALGLIHEHQNPEGGIPWNVPAVLRYYMGPPNNWSRAEVYQQVLQKYTGPLTNGGYDKQSIMEYPIDPALVTDPAYAVGWNTGLSDKDKAFIGLIYPGHAANFTLV